MTPEAHARQHIDHKLEQAGWIIQDMRALNLGAGLGVAVREYPTDTGPADYVLFVNREAVGVIEAKKDSAGATLTVAESQTARYASAALKWRQGNQALRFLFEATGQIIRFTDGADPAPRSREIFHFFRPLEKKPGIALKDLLQGVARGNRDDDTVLSLGNRLVRLAKQLDGKAQALATNQRFADYFQQHRDDVAALGFFYQQPYQRRTAFPPEQMDWLRLMKDHIASSCSIHRDDFDYAELADHSGLQKSWQVFDLEPDSLMDEMNWEMVA